MSDALKDPGLPILALCALVLALPTADATGQLRPSAQPDTAQSSQDAATSPLNPYGELGQYAQRHTQGGSMPALESGGPPLQLNRSERLLWGTAGLLMSALCRRPGVDQIGTPDPMTDPAPLPSALPVGGCSYCDRLERRAVDAVVGGLFSSSP